MLPYSTLERKSRDIAKGRMDGRSVEIQRLIGRSLRAVVDLEALGQRTLMVDCDVLQADGGTRTAAITGACVALVDAFEWMVARGKLKRSPVRRRVAGVSVGIVRGEARLDLEYSEDVVADVDMNVVMSSEGRFVEVQGTAEQGTFDRAQLDRLLDLASRGLGELDARQRAALGL